MTREVGVGRAPPRVVGVILMVLGISVTVIGAEESDPFDLMDASTPAEARARCITVLSQCRQQCGTVPEGNSEAMGPWEACLSRCDASAAKCQAAVQAAWPEK